MKLRSFHQLLPFTLLTVTFTLPLAAQTSVTLDGASGNQTFNVARSTTGGLTIGLGFGVEYLVIGGGGGGGYGFDDGPGGGGGAGGLLQGNLTFETATSIGVAVGAGGSANSGNGGNSSFENIIALGGGGGGASRDNGLSGGSGGGAGGRPVGGTRNGGTASIGQGNSGGGNSGSVSGGFGKGGGGGGGAGSAGASSSTRTGAAGGAGLSLDISGTNVSYAVGGSGGSGGTGAAVNASIIGGGGRGAFGGNNGGSTQSGGKGAVGIVIARYKGTSAGTGGTVTAGTGTAAGYTLHTFTSTGASALDFSGLNLNSRLGAIENGVISGSGGLTFSGPGTLTLGGANTFTGDTRVGLGTLSLNHSNALAGSTLNMASSDDGTVAFGLTGNNTYNIGGITGSKNLAIGGNVLSVGANNANSTYSGQISGIGSLTKSGTSTLTMSGANSYSGGTTVSAGKLTGTTTAIQGAVVNNAAVEFNQSTNGSYAGAMSGTGSLTKSGAGTVTLGGANSYSGGTTVSAGKLAGTTTTIRGAVVNDAAVEFNQSTDGTYAGAMSGTGALAKNGTGAVTLTAANSYTGGTTINSGSLLTSAANRLADSGGVAVASGATFELGGNETIASLSGAGQVKVGTATLTTGASDSTFSGTLYGAGDLVKAGAGSFTLSGNSGLSTFTGNAVINGGTLVLASANALNSGTVVTMTGGTLTVNQRTIIGALDQGSGVVNGTGELVSALTVTSSGALNGILADGVDYAAGILKRTSGTTTIGAANTFTGAIKVQGGTLQLASGGSFDATSSLAMSADGTMDLNNKSQSFTAVNGTGGTVALGSGALSVNGSSDSNFAGSITGTGSLAKSGGGKLALTGASSYTGATVVSGGLLVINGSTSTSVLTTIQSGATLGGSGTVGALTVQAGGTVAPGNSPGILSTGNYNQAGTLSLELNGTLAGAEYDQVNVSGTVNLSGLLTATVGYTPVNDQLLFILNNDGSDAITGTFSGIADLDTIDLGGYQWRISYTANYAGSNTGTFTGGNDIALMAIPEPSALVLLGLSTFCLVSRRRRKA